MADSRVLRFGAFRLDLASQCLLRGRALAAAARATATRLGMADLAQQCSRLLLS